MRAISPRCLPAPKGAGFLFLAHGAFAPELRSSHAAFISWQPLKGLLSLVRLWILLRLRPKRILVFLHTHLIFQNIGPFLLPDILLNRRIIQSHRADILSLCPKVPISKLVL